MNNNKFKPIDITDKYKPIDMSDKYDPISEDNLKEIKLAVLDRSIGLRLEKSLFHGKRSFIQKIIDKLPYAMLAYGGKALDWIPLPSGLNKWLSKGINAIAKYFHIECKEIPLKI